MPNHDPIIAAKRRAIAREVFAEVFKELGESVVADLAVADLLRLLVDHLEDGPISLWTRSASLSRFTEATD